jgi:flagellar biosynthesis anti-sigma factor FlgM
MRIDSFNSTAGQIGGEPSTKRVSPENVAAPESDGSGDRTTLTSGSSSVSSLVSEAMNSPEVRQNKVESLQQQISNGTYQLDPDKIAGAMIDEHA